MQSFFTYILQDSIGDILKGGFYEQELSKSKTVDVYMNLESIA